MRTGRGFERLVNFSDAVVAIALTLLVLPLVEITSELTGSQSLGSVLADHRSKLISFAISFLVIWSLWAAHHRTMEHFRGYDQTLIRLHLVWLLTIVVLPFTTQLLNSDEYNHGAVPLYIGTLLVSSLALLGISWRGRRRPGLLHADRAEVQTWLADPISVVTAGIMLLAFVLSIVVPVVGTWPLLLLLLDDPLDTLIAKLTGRQRPHRTA